MYHENILPRSHPIGQLELSGCSFLDPIQIQLFNLRHSSLRNVIERTFGCVKNKFPILSRMPSYSFRTQAKLILTALAIHNFFRIPSNDPNCDNCVVELSSENDGFTNQPIGTDDTVAAARRDEIATVMWDDHCAIITNQEAEAQEAREVAAQEARTREAPGGFSAMLTDTEALL